MARVKLGFSRYSVAVKILHSRMIVQSMAGNPNFDTVPPDIGLPVITAAINDLEQKAQAAFKGGTDKTLAMRLAEAELTTLMGKLQDYVQVASNGDPMIIESSGMEVRKERERATVLEPVRNPRANVGGNPGEIVLRWDGIVGAKGYVVEMKLPDSALPEPIPQGPENEVVVASPAGTVNWLRMDTVSKTRVILSGLTTGMVHSFRIAAFNSAGQGDYSQVVSSVTP